MELNGKRAYAVKVSDIKCVYFSKISKEENLKDHGFPWCMANVDCSQYDEETRKLYSKFKDKYIIVTSHGFKLIEIFTGKIIANLEENINVDVEETIEYIQLLKKHPLNVEFVHWSVGDKDLVLLEEDIIELKKYLDILEKSAEIIFNDSLAITAEEDYRCAVNENKVYEYKKQNNLL